MRRRVGGLAALTALVVTACGGSDGSDEGAEVTPAPVEASTTVEVASPSTEPPPTEAATTTEATTTTLAPTTTIDPTIALANEVEKDFRRARRLELEASMDPTNNAAVRRALARRIGPELEAASAYFDRLATSRQAIRESERTAPRTTIEVPATPVADGAGVVELQECEVDSWVVVEVGGAPDGSDAIVDDAVHVHRRVVILRETADGWKVEGTRKLGEWVGVEECPAE